MQKELMLRLLKDGKIVGYLWLLDDEINQSKDMEEWYAICNPLTFIGSDGYIDYDSFELGIKVGDEYWFEGDEVLTDEAGWEGHIVFTGSAFIVKDDIGGFASYCNWDKYKRIGNIHEDK